MKPLLLAFAILLSLVGFLLWRQLATQREQTAEAEARLNASRGAIEEVRDHSERESRKVEEGSRR